MIWNPTSRSNLRMATDSSAKSGLHPIPNRLLAFALISTLTLAIAACSSKSALPDSSAINAQPETDGKEGCSTPLGFIAEGGVAKGYLRPVEQGGMTCQAGEITCGANGQWSGAYIHPTCIRQP